MAIKLSSLEVFGVAIRSEIDAARAYQKMATLVESKDGQQKLHFLRNEERKHRAMLEEMYRKEYPDIKLELPAKGLAPKLVVAVEKNSPITKLYELAMEAEQATEKFYAQAAEQSESQSGRRLLSYLSGMERGHYYLLKAEYDLMAEFDRFQSYKKFSMEHVGG
jgi:rubrerythrin